MAETGIKTTDLAGTPLLDAILGNRNGTTTSQTIEDLATQLASSGPLAKAAGFDTVQDLIADTSYGYGSGTLVAAGDIIRAEGFRYSVVVLGSANYTLATAGGVLLQALPSTEGSISVVQCGARGIGVGFDDTVAFNKALHAATIAPIRDEYASTYRVVIPPTNDFYHITSDWIIDRNVIIEGATPNGRGLGAGKIKFADTCVAGMFFRGPGGLSAPSPYDTELGVDAWSSGRSILRDVILEPVNPNGVDLGIIHNNPCVFERVLCQYFAKANFFAAGQSSGNSAYPDVDEVGGATTMYGNTNGSRYNFCFAFNGGRHGFCASGNNTQIMKYEGCDATGNKGCGFRDNSSIGNYYDNCHTAQNTFRALHNGVRYMSIKDHVSAAINEPGVGADWEEFWIVVVATLEETTWSLGQSYHASGGINIIETAGNYPIITGHYTEGGIEFGLIPRGNTVIVGGVAGGGRTRRHGADTSSVQVLGTGLSNTPPKWLFKGDTFDWGSSLGSAANVATFFETGHTDDPDAVGAAKGVKLVYSTARRAYEWVKGLSTIVMTITTANWTKNGYSGAGNIRFDQGLIVGGDSSVRVKSYTTYAAIPDSHAFVVGEMVLFSDPVNNGAISSGVCVTAGTKLTTLAIRQVGVTGAVMV